MMLAGSLSRIHQISMRAHDIDRAVRFYRDALGLPFLFAAPLASRSSTVRACV